MSDVMVVEGVFRKNKSLVNALVSALQDQGVGLLDRIRFRIQYNMLSDDDQQKIEREVTDICVKAGAVFPVAAIVGGVFTGNWMEFIQMLIDNLPKILDFISKLLPLFFLELIWLLALIGLSTLIVL